MANYFSSVKKINPRGVEDDVLEIYVDTSDIYRMNNILAEAGTYTFVVWYCSAANCKITFNVLGTEETIEATPVWNKYIKTVQYDGTNNNIDIIQDLKSTIYLYEGYITKGSQDKSWSLAPEDFEQSIENANSLTVESMTYAQQTADKFTWLVKSGTDETNFTLTSRTADLVAEQINLKGLVTFSGLNTSTQDKIDLINKFGSEEVIEGVTLINGGYIQTNTLSAEALKADQAFLDKLYALHIKGDFIEANTITANLLNLYGLRVLQQDTDIETLSIENTGDVTLRGNVESYDYIAGQSGWSIKSNGDAEFNDVVVRGDLINASGGIVATDPNAIDRQVVAWFGTSYEERESAPLIFYSDGYMKSMTGEFSGIFTGDIQIGNISIIDPSKYSGNDAILTIQNGDNGIKRVQLTDTGASSFAQDIKITDNFENTSILLSQDGYINANGGYVVGNNSFDNNGVHLGKNEIIGGENSLNILSETLDVGTLGNATSLRVWGNSTFNQSAKFNGDIILGNSMILSHNSDGFDINFIYNTLTFTVTFETNGGSSIAPIRDVVALSKITAPSNPTRNGYSFAGWYKDSLLNIKFDFATDTINADTTLYAKWNVVPAKAPTYTITQPTGSTNEYGMTTWSTPYIINGVSPDGGTLSYHWEVNYHEGSAELVALEDVFASKTSNNISVTELNQYAYWTYGSLQGKCTITNTKLGTTASTTVSVYVRGQ